MPDDPWSWLQKGAKTVPIDFATSGDHTVHSVTGGRRFCVHYVFLQAENVVDVLFKSGSTALTGALAFAANTEKTWDNSGTAVFAGRATGENFVLNLSGNIQVNGFAVVTEMSA